MFVKHFVRFNTRDELDDYDVIGCNILEVDRFLNFECCCPVL